MCKEFLKPTKLKIKSLGVLLIGIAVPTGIKYFSNIYYARTLGPEKHPEFINYLQTNIALNLGLLIIYILWLYLIISIILNIAKKKPLLKR